MTNRQVNKPEMRWRRKKQTEKQIAEEHKNDVYSMIVIKDKNIKNEWIAATQFIKIHL